MRRDPDGANEARDRRRDVGVTIARDAIAGHAIDGIAPRSVERPGDAAGAARVLREAHEAHEAVVAWGGGTRIGIGDTPERYDLALDLTSLAGVVDHSPADLVCTVRAGTTLAELAATLARSGQRWPVDAADPERATVGGTIASAAPAPSRLRFQHPRDWIIGCEAVLGDGTRARAGGRVVKNVTGFDLTRLYSGTYGTLAVMLEVSLKLVAADDASRVLSLRADDVAPLAALARDLRRTLALDGIVVVSGASPTLLVRAAGTAAAVERVTRDLARAGVSEEAAPGAWEATMARATRETTAARCAVGPGEECDVIGGDGAAYVGTGIAYRFGMTAEEQRSLRARCARAGGALVLERAPVKVRRELGTWGTLRAPGAIARRLKAGFDPRAVLAPGRIAL